MTPSNVHIIHPTSPPLAGFLRVAHAGHHKLEFSDKRVQRLVVDAKSRLTGPGGMLVIQGGRP